MSKPQVIRDADGAPAYVVVPVEEWQEMNDLAEAAGVREGIREGEETVPHAALVRLLAGEAPVRVYRDLRGLTQRDLAARAGITQAMLSAIENGRKRGSVETLAGLARALAVTLDELVGGDGSR